MCQLSSTLAIPVCSLQCVKLPHYDSLKRNHLLYILLLLLEKFSHVKCNLILSYLTNSVHILYFPPSVFAIYLYTFWAMADVSSISLLTMLMKVQYHSADEV